MSLDSLGIRLAEQGRKYQRLYIVQSLLGHIVLLEIAWLIVASADFLFPFRENTVHAILNVSVFVCLCSLLAQICIRNRSFTSKSICYEICKNHPELQDSLICSLELEERMSSLNGLEQVQLRRTRELFAEHEKEWLAKIEYRYSWRYPLLYLSVSVLLGCLLGIMPFASKMRWYSDSGIAIVRPADNLAIIHEDVVIQAKVLRGPGELTIEYRSDSENGVFPMHPQEGGISEFTLFDVSENLEYRLSTERLRTDWISLDVYAPPVLKDISVQVKSPEYTGRQPVSLNSFSDVTLVKGGDMEVTVVLENGHGLILSLNEQKQALQETSEGCKGIFIPAASGVCSVTACDSRGRERELAQFTVTLEADRPPVIDRHQPEDDVKIKESGNVKLDVTALDDFGITTFELCYRKLGEAGHAKDLLGDNRLSCEVPCACEWNLGALALHAGDVLSCVLKARDNCVPQANETIGKVFFVTVVPDADNLDASDAEAQSKEVTTTIDDLLAESKRLLRISWELASLHVEDLSSRCNDIAQALEDLRLETVRRKFEIARKGGEEVLPEPMETFFHEAASFMQNASAGMKQSLVKESIEFQEAALSRLVKIDTMLAANRMQSEKAKGKGQKQEKASEDKEQQAQDDNENGQNEDDDAEDQEDAVQTANLAKAIEAIKKIIPEQEHINRLLQKTTQEVSAEQERELGHEVASVERSLLDIQEALQGRQKLQEASAEMIAGSRLIAETERKKMGDSVGRREKAFIHGTRSVRALKDALALLEGVQKRLNGNQLKKLSKSMQALADRQRKAGEASAQAQEQKMSRAEGGALREEQDKLNRKLSKLDEKLVQASQKLQEDFPEAAQLLREMHTKIGSEGVSGTQRKAANALLYGRYGRASEEQLNASEKLSKLSKEFDAAADALQLFTREDLLSALERLQKLMRNAEEIQNGSEGEQSLGSLKNETGKELGYLSRLLKDDKLSSLEAKMNNDIGTAQDILATLRETARITADYLRKMEHRRHDDTLKGKMIAPPERYRRLVEEYFKELN